MKTKAETIKRPVEQISSSIKKTAWSNIIESLALMILGILFVILPDTMITILSYIVGAFFIVKGCYGVILYFLEKGQKDFFDNNLLSGVVSILIGIAALVIGEDIANVFRVIIGIIIIYESIVRINAAVKLSNVGVSSWKYVLVLALIMLVLGIFVIFNSGAVVALVGWLMIATGLIGIVGDVLFIQHINAIVDKLTNIASSK